MNNCLFSVLCVFKCFVLVLQGKWNVSGLIVSSLGVSPKSGYADDQFWLIHEPHSEHSSHEGTLKLETVSETIDKSSPIGKRLAQGRETDEDFYWYRSYFAIKVM